MPRRQKINLRGHRLQSFERDDVSYMCNGSASNWTAVCECGWKSDHRMVSEKWARDAHRAHKLSLLSKAVA